MADKLTRDQIDFVLDNMTGADLIDHIGDGTRGARIAGDSFDAAAVRLGVSNGSRAMELVGMADFSYLVNKLQEVMNLDSPKADQPEPSQDSVSTGE